MSGEINWKQKYQELKSKYMNSVDMAFRLGVEEGMKQSQVDQAAQDQADAQMQQEAMAGGADPNAAGSQDQNNNGAPGVPQDPTGGEDRSGAPSAQPGAPAGVPMQESENPQGSELDQHIATLEGMLKKNEDVEGFDAESVLKSINGLKQLKSSMVQQHELRKSAQAIPKIAKALHKPQFKFGVQAQHNLSSNAKNAVSMQHKIVNDVMQKMQEEEAKASKDILSTLSVEGIVKGE